MPHRSPTLLVLFAAAACAQTPHAPAPAPPPQLSPKAAYTEAMHPLEQTRASIGNWSDAETQALGVSVQQAAKACEAREPKSFTGDDLIDLARLCGLGQNWPAVAASATLYINATPTDGTPQTKPLLIRAYAARLDAELHLKDEPAAFRDGRTMLSTLPFDSLTADVINEAIDYMHFSATADAITLARAREPLLLARLALPPAAPHPPHQSLRRHPPTSARPSRRRTNSTPTASSSPPCSSSTTSPATPSPLSPRLTRRSPPRSPQTSPSPSPPPAAATRCSASRCRRSP